MVIGMRSKELIKSIILILLVLMSVVLTYMTWNFSPDLANVDNQGSNSKDYEPNSIGKPLNQGMDQIITPYQVVHSKGDQTEGMEATKQISKPY